MPHESIYQSKAITAYERNNNLGLANYWWEQIKKQLQNPLLPDQLEVASTTMLRYKRKLFDKAVLYHAPANSAVVFFPARGCKLQMAMRQPVWVPATNILTFMSASENVFCIAPMDDDDELWAYSDGGPDDDGQDEDEDEDGELLMLVIEPKMDMGPMIHEWKERSPDGLDELVFKKRSGS